MRTLLFRALLISAFCLPVVAAQTQAPNPLLDQLKSSNADQRAKAVEMAAAAFETAGWHAPQWLQSPLPGRRGSIEYLLHLRRGGPPAKRTFGCK